jgi:hypothetical protein
MSNHERNETKIKPDEEPMIQTVRKVYELVFENRAAAWTAIFTCALVVFSGLLWKVTSDANETSVQTQRAFVSYSGLQIIKEPQSENDKILKGVRLFVLWVNSGTTPTKTAITEANLAMGPDTSQVAKFDALSQSAPYPIVIGPKSGTQSIPVDISSADLEELTGGARHAFVWGWTAYYDIFPNTPMRLSEYCTQVDHPIWTKKSHTDASGDIHFDTPPCPVHNCYDENCSDYPEKVQQLAGKLHGQ